jgi:hypothetical protein
LESQNNKCGKRKTAVPQTAVMGLGGEVGNVIAGMNCRHAPILLRPRFFGVECRRGDEDGHYRQAGVKKAFHFVFSLLAVDYSTTALLLRGFIATPSGRYWFPE